MVEATEILNFLNGGWSPSVGKDTLKIVNPATGAELADNPVGDAGDVSRVVDSAARAFPGWRSTPPGERVQYLFRFKQLLEDHFEEIARLTTQENGKTLAESRGELRRGIENVEVACGIPILMQGYNLEDVARGIDETMIRQPLGVVAAITPLQLSLHDSPMVLALRPGLWQQLCAEAVRAGAVDHDAGV